MNLLVELLVSLGAVLVLAIAAEIIWRAHKKRKRRDKNDIAAKIKSISDSLHKSAVELDDMQKQIKERIAFVEELSEKARQATEIASLSKKQISAVNDILSNNLKQEGRRSFWEGVLVNFVFFVLGAIVSYLPSVFI